MAQNAEQIRLIIYEKDENAIYLSHLDTMETLFKAFRRAQIPYAVTQGCHVRPKSSFGPPLSLGQGSCEEWCLVYLTEDVAPLAMQERLRPQLPRGLRIQRVSAWKNGDFFPTQMTPMRMRFTIAEARRDVAGRIREFLGNPDHEFTLPVKQGTKTYHLGKTIRGLQETVERDGLRLELDFHPGDAGSPSFGKALLGLLDHLAADREAILRIDRLSFFPPSRT